MHEYLQADAEELPDGEGGLGTRPDVYLPIREPLTDRAMSFHGHVLNLGLPELVLHDHICLFETSLDISLPDLEVICDVRVRFRKDERGMFVLVEVLVHERLTLLQGIPLIEDSWQLFVLHLYELDGSLGYLFGVGRNRHHRFSNVPNFLYCKHRLVLHVDSEPVGDVLPG